MARFMVGIDLGTTNSALAVVDTQAKGRKAGVPETFAVPQLVGPGEMKALPLLPSFLYLPGPHDLPAGATALPWNPDATDVVGVYARSVGAKVPGRLVSSAKSWLCHAGVDRTAELLPWGAPPDVPRVSPLEASARFLKYLVNAWNAAPGRRPEDRLEGQAVTLTVPASFDDTARHLTAEAAKVAGLTNVSLIEEPQAAFYAWLATHPPKEAGRLKPGMRCLVVDVGGGTSDFSLIRAGEADGDLTFQRDAVGDHLLLGGDNMDLALAKTVEARLSAKLDAAQFGALVQACRAAKERLLGDDPPAEVPVTVTGRGRSVVASSVSTSVTKEDVTAAILDGFFPVVPFDAEPERGERGGLHEMGLPYVADAAVTRHLAAFLRPHLHEAGTTVDAILFNGGVFTPKALRDRLVEVMHGWFDTPAHKWKPLLLTTPSLDLAVAWGAAYAGFLKQSGGRRIVGGIPRSYYLAVEDKNRPAGATGLDVVCVVPRQLDEGQEVRIEKPVFELALGQPVLFPLYSSTVRGDDGPGDLLRPAEHQLLKLPPLHTILRGGKRAGVKRVPVTLAAKCTEIGTLELSCVSAEGNRWRLEFNVRDGGATARPAAADSPPPPPMLDLFPEERVSAGGELIRSCFTKGEPTPAELPRKLEAAYDANRGDWPTALCRRAWDDLAAVSDQRARSPQHLSRWYNLVGFCLRPGFGDPLDKYRIDALWKLVNAPGATPPGGPDFWILCRRMAGGLNTSLQQLLWGRLKPVLLPGRGKAGGKVALNELAEMWRAAAALERLDARMKVSLGEELLAQVKRETVPHYAFWALTRLGARHLFYGPLNAVVHPDIVEGWVRALLAATPPTDADRTARGFAVAQLARRTGLRGVDLPDESRPRIAAALRADNVPEAWPAMVERVVADGAADADRLFGEALPVGLRLA
jgi:molecular chaperone DnaK (HSP70)